MRQVDTLHFFVYGPSLNPACLDSSSIARPQDALELRLVTAQHGRPVLADSTVVAVQQVQSQDGAGQLLESTWKEHPSTPSIEAMKLEETSALEHFALALLLVALQRTHHE